VCRPLYSILGSQNNEFELQLIQAREKIVNGKRVIIVEL
jgi:hypothetical protein